MSRGGVAGVAERYLRALFDLEEHGVEPKRARLAERLGLPLHAVCAAVDRLRARGLVVLGEDRLVLLTPHGRDLARTVVRRHRLVECLLADVIRLDPDLIEDEACRWEHAISERAERRLDDFLGRPRATRDGRPIPAVDADVSCAPTS